MTARSWVPTAGDGGFGIDHLPYGVLSGDPPAVGVAIGEYVLDLAGLATAGLIEGAAWFTTGSLNAFMAAGRPAWRRTRARITELLTEQRHRPMTEPHLRPRAEVTMLRPFEVADYVDFYSSLDHAANVGRIFRPDAPAIPENWRHLPAGYHGRAGTVVVSGTPITRPCGQSRGTDGPRFGPSARLDIEAEIGYVVGTPSAPGRRVRPADFRDHVFGFVLVNDWSARDVQAWEYQPLGPFLGKSFATSISSWVTPVAALEAARITPPRQQPPPLDHLRCAEPWGLDITLEVELNGHVIARPPYGSMYWTPPQQLAHATSNGASLRTGDLFASGTVSGPHPAQRGSLLELTWDGTEPMRLPDGSQRGYLLDGDTVVLRATAPGATGGLIALGEVAGVVYPAAGAG